MLETSTRLLRLLSLLQTHRQWSGASLADELGITTRTVRRDVDRLREMGYPVEALRGIAGYRLGPGASMPPLLLEDDEAVAMAICLRIATKSSVAGIEDMSLRALAKLDHVLPPRLRTRVNRFAGAVQHGGAGGPQVDAAVLVQLSDHIHRRESLRFTYTAFGGKETARHVEPHAAVSWGRHWYLVAWDRQREDWRTFRVDRLKPKAIAGSTFEPRQPPGGDAVEYVGRQLSSERFGLRGVVVLHASADAARDRVWPGLGTLEPIDASSCRLTVGSESVEDIAWAVIGVGIDFTVVEPPALVDAVRAMSERCARAAGAA